MSIYSVSAPTLNAPLSSMVSVKVEIRPRLSVMRIKCEVCEHYGIPLSAMMSDRRARAVARPRQVAMFLAKELTLKSMPAIGREFRRDHTTVMHGVSRVDHLELTDPGIANDLLVLRKRLAA